MTVQERDQDENRDGEEVQRRTRKGAHIPL